MPAFGPQDVWPMSSTKTKRAGYNVFVQEKRKEVAAELEAEGTKNKRGEVQRRLGESKDTSK